jgi:hypothetical protein
MAYLPEWLLLPEALQRVMAMGVGEGEAKTDLCRAVADRKIDVRVRIAGTNRAFSDGNVGVPTHLSAGDLDWVKSRPLAQWSIGPRLGEHYAWLEGWKNHPLDLIELSTADVIEVLTGGEDEKKTIPTAAREPSSRYAGRPSVKPSIITKLRARAAEGSVCEKLADEAGYLLRWAHEECAGQDGLPSTQKVVENQIRDEFRRLRGKPK